VTPVCTLCGAMDLPCKCPYLKNVRYPAQDPRIRALEDQVRAQQALLVEAREVLKRIPWDERNTYQDELLDKLKAETGDV